MWTVDLTEKLCWQVRPWIMQNYCYISMELYPIHSLIAFLSHFHSPIVGVLNSFVRTYI